jgi:hypothetical protein
MSGVLLRIKTDGETGSLRDACASFEASQR